MGSFKADFTTSSGFASGGGTQGKQTLKQKLLSFGGDEKRCIFVNVDAIEEDLSDEEKTSFMKLAKVASPSAQKKTPRGSWSSKASEAIFIEQSQVGASSELRINDISLIDEPIR